VLEGDDTMMFREPLKPEKGRNFLRILAYSINDTPGKLGRHETSALLLLVVRVLLDH